MLLAASLHPCLTLQKRQSLRALHHISALDVDEQDNVDDAQTANQIAFQQLSDLVDGTVIRGEGNSCLLLGPRGSGKTSVSLS
jgi:origin recognition complex subunit 4